MSLRWRIETQHLRSPLTGWPVGTSTLLPATPQHCVCVYAVLFGSTANCRFYFSDTNNDRISGDIFGAVSTTAVIPQQDNADPWWITPRGTGLQIVVTTGPIYGDIYYLVVPDYLPPASVT
jgi:hypothetical protein